MLILFWKAALLIPVTLLPILNPLGNAAVFANLVARANRTVERRIARQVALNCWFLLVGAMFIGSHVLAFFGISLPVVRVAGGLLVASTGWHLLRDTASDPIRAQVADDCEDDWSSDALKLKSFYPISFPLTVGPGSIAASITLGASAPTRLLDWVVSFGSAAVGAGLTTLAIYLCYRHARALVGLLGRLGTLVALRLSAFILVCVGIEIVWHGLTDLVAESAKALHL